MARVLIKVWRKYPMPVLALGLLVTVALVALFAPLVATHDPNALHVARRLSPPGEEFLLGSDHLGRDVWSRLVYGARVSLWVGTAVTGVTVIGGILLGMVAGYYSWADATVMRVMDGLMAFPAILLAIAIMAVLGPQIGNVIVALSIVYVPRTVRVVRASVLAIRERELVQAARALGAGDLRILFRHILPNCLSPLIVQATFNFANAILAEAALSFLGAGVPPELPSWGGMMAEGRDFLRQAPWITLFPGLATMVTVLALNILGDGLRDALDPRLQRQAS